MISKPIVFARHLVILERGRDEARELRIGDRAHAHVHREARGTGFPAVAIRAEPAEELIDHDAVEVGVRARVLHVLHDALGRDAEFIVRVRVAHENFVALRAAGALELHELLHVEFENLAVVLELAGAGGGLRRLVHEFRLDIHVAVDVDQRFHFRGDFLGLDFVGRLVGDGVVLDEFGDRSGRLLDRSSRGSRSVWITRKSGRFGSGAAGFAAGFAGGFAGGFGDGFSSAFGSMSEISKAMESDSALPL